MGPIVHCSRSMRDAQKADTLGIVHFVEISRGPFQKREKKLRRLKIRPIPHDLHFRPQRVTPCGFSYMELKLQPCPPKNECIAALAEA